MADVKNSAEPTFPTKRIPDQTTQDSTNEPKKQKLENPDNNFDNPDNNFDNTATNFDNNGIQPQQNDDVQKEKQTVEEEIQEEEEEEEEPSNGKAVIDRKGKGILIEEDEEDEEDDDGEDDSDDSDSNDSLIGDELSEDSDFADDPLAEVDLDNILPSRTRRKVIHPGVYLRNDIPQDDSDDSDDPDV